MVSDAGVFSISGAGILKGERERRIARYSNEQNGYERHRTQGARLKSPTRSGIGDAIPRWREKVEKPAPGFKRGVQKF
jgi:hypothetical protein